MKVVYGENFEQAAAWVKQRDPNRLVHYENAIFQHSAHQNDTSNLDFHSEMYTSSEELDAYFADAKNQKPYLFCEYLHAMGEFLRRHRRLFPSHGTTCRRLWWLCVGVVQSFALYAKFKQDGLWRGF